jgi:hypothetical protein
VGAANSVNDRSDRKRRRAIDAAGDFEAGVVAQRVAVRGLSTLADLAELLLPAIAGLRGCTSSALLGQPYCHEDWPTKLARQLRVEHTLRPAAAPESAELG